MLEKEEFITLVDEEGAQFDFLILDYFKIGEQDYVILLPLLDGEINGEQMADQGLNTLGEAALGVDEEEAIIFRVVKGNNGEKTLQTIDDEDEWQKVAREAYDRLLAIEDEEE